MSKIKIVIEMIIKADPNDEDAIREMVYDKLTYQLEAEEVEFRIEENEDDEDDEEYN